MTAGREFILEYVGLHATGIPELIRLKVCWGGDCNMGNSVRLPTPWAGHQPLEGRAIDFHPEQRRLGG